MGERLTEQQGLSNWIENNFNTHSPIRTLKDFHTSASERLQSVENLPEDARMLRKNIRELLGIPLDTPCVVIGEQTVGLNEPPLIIGKRVLVKAMEAMAEKAEKQWQVVSYHLGADVAGSETGISTVTLPNPYSPNGIGKEPIISKKKWGDIPTFAIPTSEIKPPEDLIKKLYPNNNRVSTVLGRYKPKEGEDNSYADVQNRLLLEFLEELGLYDQENDKLINDDVKFDTLMAQIGGLQLIMKRWDNILNMAHQENNKRKVCRVPESTEAPFYTFFEIEDPKKGKVFIRVPVVINDDNTFSAYPPRYKEKGIKSPLFRFTTVDILEGRILISWRAIPRAILFALAFDAHITGGGALYNEAVAGPFETLFNVSYFPIAHLDLADENGNRRSPFIYHSSANRKAKAPYLRLAEEAVIRGLVSSLDMAMSIDPEKAKEIINQQIYNFQNMGQIIDLREASIIRPRNL